jgi:hypothetical protein
MLNRPCILVLRSASYFSIPVTFFFFAGTTVLTQGFILACKAGTLLREPQLQSTFALAIFLG